MYYLINSYRFRGLLTEHFLSYRLHRYACKVAYKLQNVILFVSTNKALCSYLPIYEQYLLDLKYIISHNKNQIPMCFNFHNSVYLCQLIQLCLLKCLLNVQRSSSCSDMYPQSVSFVPLQFQQQ